MIIVAMGWGAWRVYDWHRHRILVFLPDGSQADAPTVTLDYDPVSDYRPTRITGEEGTVYIPSARAYGRGWEVMHINSVRGDQRYHASLHPPDCRYPMTVILEEVPALPPPSPPSTIEQGVDLLKTLKKMID